MKETDFAKMMQETQKMAQGMTEAMTGSIGAAMAPAMEQSLAAFAKMGAGESWPVMSRDMMEGFFGKTINQNGLDAKTRLLLTLAGLVMQMGFAQLSQAAAPTQASGTAFQEPALRLTLRHAAEAGASAQEIYEAIALVSVFGAGGAVMRAAQIAAEILGQTEEDKE